MESGFRGYHPYIIFFYYICAAILLMYFNHPLFLCVAFLLFIAVNGCHDRCASLKKWTVPFIWMSVFFILLNALFVSRGTHILFYFRGNQVTLEAIVYGVVMAITVLSIMMLFTSFNLILNGNKFLYVFSKFLPRTALLLLLALRFIPLLRKRFAEISAVQRVRGTSMSVGSIRERARNGMLMVQVLLTWSLEEAIQTADSMKARGYGIGRKSSYIPYKMGKRDWIWGTTLLLLSAFCLWGGIFGYGKIMIYPQLGTLHLYPLDWILLSCMTIILSFPLLVEGRERLRWRK